MPCKNCSNAVTVVVVCTQPTELLGNLL